MNGRCLDKPFGDNKYTYIRGIRCQRYVPDACAVSGVLRIAVGIEHIRNCGRVKPDHGSP